MIEQQQQLQLVQNISEISIPQDFKDRFIYNLERKDEWWTSQYAFDTWFNKYYKRYQEFLRGIDRELLIEIDYKISVPSGTNKNGKQKRQMLVSFKALKQLEMKCDKETRKYHIQLEDYVQQFMIKYHQDKYIELQKDLQDLEQTVEEQKQEIEEFKAMRKRGVIYKIFNINDMNEFYIGSHEGIDPQDRWKTHISSALASLKQPLYRRIFREGMNQFRIEVVKYVDYYHQNELLDEEQKKIIDDQNPSMNRNYFFNCDCGKSLQQEHAIYMHRQQCQEYQPIRYIEDDQQMQVTYNEVQVSN